MAAKAHAILSASSSDRWLHCPPSARLCETYEDKGSDYAAEGTDAHALGEHKLKTALGLPSEDPTDTLKWYSEEMEDCTSGYADDSVYYMVSNNNGYSGDFELALIPESFLTDVMHEVEDANGVIAENKDVEPEHFALLFEFSGDQRKIRHCMYYCSATRPSVSGSTKEDSTEVQTETLSITATPLPSGLVKVKTGTNTSEETYNNWYNAVYQPQAAVNVPETPAEDVTE